MSTIRKREENNLNEQEKVIQNLLERIENDIVQAMTGPNGETFYGPEEYVNGLIKAYRIIENYEPNPPVKIDELIKSLKDKDKDKNKK